MKNDNGTESNEEEENENTSSPVRRSKRKKTTPVKPPAETPIAHRKKRIRKTSKKAEEAQKAQEEEKAQKETLKPKRKYRKRQKKDATNNANGGDSQQKSKTSKSKATDDSSSLDDDAMVCCVCKCSVDYSDKDQFHWPEEVDSDSENQEESSAGQGGGNTASQNDDKAESAVDQNGTKMVTNATASSIVSTEKESLTTQSAMDGEKHDDSSEESDYYGVKLPNSLYDSNNALLICDGKGCNRCYHQRCHFVPVLSVPRREWYCLICQYKDAMKTSQKGKRGRKPKTPPKKQNAKYDTSELHKTAPIEAAELDTIFRISPRQVCTYAPVSTTDDGVMSPIAKSIEAQEVVDSKTSTRQTIEINVENTFEFHSATLKAELVRKGSQNLVKLIDSNLSNVRLCQNSIRTLTEGNNRARKELIEKYNRTHRLPQELVQNVRRLARCKLKLREVFHTLQNVIRNKNDRQELCNWFMRAKSEGKFTPAKICKGKDMPVPEIISLESSEAGKEGTAPKKENAIDITELEKKLFDGPVTRKEPRFDIKDYDADEDDGDSDSDVPVDIIKCCICFSGHVEEDNDVVMCDGKHCFRAFHMKCCAPHVTQKMLDDDEDGVWFCPYCVCFAKTIHYAETEYLGYIEVDEEASTKSWEVAEDVFPEAANLLKAAEKWMVGERNENSDKILASLLGIEIAKEPGCDDGGDENDGDDESDDSFGSEHASQDSGSSVSDDSDDSSGVDWDVEKSELSALSYSESESDSDDDNNDGGSGSGSGSGKGTKARRSRRLEKGSEKGSDRGNDSDSRPVTDVGKLDTMNIVRGKRNRAKVDYTSLNDSMFGKVNASSIDDEEEYHFVMKSRGQSGSDSDSDNSSSDGSDDGSDNSNSDEEDGKDSGGDENADGSRSESMTQGPKGGSSKRKKDLPSPKKGNKKKEDR